MFLKLVLAFGSLATGGYLLSLFLYSELAHHHLNFSTTQHTTLKRKADRYNTEIELHKRLASSTNMLIKYTPTNPAMKHSTAVLTRNTECEH